MQKIVIIDDNSIIRLVLSSMFLHTFKDFEFETFTADNGVAGLGYVFITKPDLIIVDITLPKYSGKEVIDFLSSNQTIVEKNIPIIVLTENESCPILPGNFKCINKSSKQFEELLQESISKILPIQSQDGLRSKLFRILSNKIINNGNKVDVTNRALFQNKLKALLSIPYLIFLNLKFSFLITLFFIFFERHEKESNIELRRKDGASLRINTIPAITVFFTLIFFSIFQISSVLGGVGIFTFLRGNENVAAASYTWDGGGSDGTCGGGVGDGNKWSCALNWSSDIVPTSLDTVTFNATSTKDAVVDSGFGGVVTSMTISAGYTGTITLQRSLQTTTTFSQAAGTFTATNQSLDIDSTFTLTGGSFTASSGNTFLGAGLTSNGAGTFNANGGIVTLDSANGGSIGCTNITFNLVIISGTQTKTIESTCNIPLGASPTITSVSLNGTLSGTGTFNVTSVIVFNSAAVLSGFTAYVGGSGSMSINGATINFSAYSSFSTNGSVTLSSGSLSLPATADLNDNLTISGGIFTAPSGTMTLAGILNITGAPTFNANGGTITFDGAIGATMSCNNVTFNLVTFNNSASKSFPAGCNIPLGNNPILLGSATVSIDGGTFSGTGKFTKSASTFGMSTATAQLTGFTEFQANAVSISNNAVLDLSTYTSALFTSTLFLTSGTVTVPNGADFNLGITQSGGTFNAPAGNMTLDGNLLISGTAVFNANGGTITFDGTQFSSANCNSTSIFNNVIVAATSTTIKTFSACPTVPLGNNPTTTRTAFVNSTVSGTGTWTMAGGGDTAFTSGSVISGFTGISAQGFTVNGANLNLSGLTSFVQGPAGNTVSLISGSLQLPNGSDINGSLTISGGTFTAPSGTLNIAQSLTISGAPTFNANGGTVNFDSANGGTLTCNNVTFNLVSFTHTLNTKVVSSNCTLPLGNNPVLGTANGSTGVINNGILTGTGTLNTGVFTFNTGSSLVGFTDMNLGSTFTVAGGTADFSSYTTFFATSAAGGAPVVLNSGSLTLPNGADLNSLFTITGGTFNAPSGNMTVAGSFTVSGSPTFNANSGTITFDGSGGTLTCNSVVFNSVVLNHVATTVKTINNGCNLPLGNNPSVSGGVFLHGTLLGTGLITFGGSATTTLNTTGSFSGFNGVTTVSGSFVVAGATANFSGYNSFTGGNAVSLTSGTFSLPNGTDLNSNLTISGGTFNAPSGTMNLAGNLTISGTPTFNANGGTVIFDGSNAVLTCNNVVFNQVTFSHIPTDEKVISDNCLLPLGNNPTVTGRVNIASTTAEITGTGILTNTSENSLNFQFSNGSISGFTGLDALGSIQISGASNIDFTNYSSVIIHGRGTDNAIRILGGTFTAPTATMTLYDRFRLTGGTFNHNNGTVEFVCEAGDLTVGPHDFSFTFYNLIVDPQIACDYINSDGTTTTILNNLTLHGLDSDNMLSIASAVPGTQWNLDASSATNIDIEFVNVTDSNSLNRIINVSGSGSIDGGNNTNWNFGNPIVENLGPANLTDGSSSTERKPTFTFDVTDPDSTDQVIYQLHVDNNSDFSSAEIVVTSELSPQGSFSFTPNTDLPDGAYYWRVRGFDEHEGVSDYVLANNGNVAFTIGVITTPTPTVTPTPTATPTITTTATPSVTQTPTPTPSMDIPVSDDNKNPLVINREVVAALVLITSFYFITSATSIIATSPNMALSINNLLALIGTFLGSIIPKNKKYWGIVFDAKVSKGMAFTIIRLINLDTKEMAETVSDVNGRYGFAASPGKYRIEVNVEGYEKFEKKIDITKDNDIVEDIKLNRIGTKDSLRMKLNLQAETISKIVKMLLLILMVSGFFYTLMIYFEDPLLTNLLILVLYLILFIVNLYLFIKVNVGSIGKVIDKESKVGLNWTSVRLFAKDRTYIALTNAQGLFRLNVPKGEYRKYIYREGYKHDAVDTVKSSNAGFINTNFELEKINNENNDEGFGSI